MLSSSWEHCPHEWIPVVMQERGYRTILISDNPWFEVGREYIGKGFDYYIVFDTLGCSKQIIETALRYIPDGEFFAVLWFTATHKPFFYPSKQNGVSDLVHKLQAIEYVDGLLGKLFHETPPETSVIATSDHGNAWLGDTCLGHNPKDINILQDTHYKVFFISGILR